MAKGRITLMLTLVDYHNDSNGTCMIWFIIINASIIYIVVKFHTISVVGTIPTKRKVGKIEKDHNE